MGDFNSRLKETKEDHRTNPYGPILKKYMLKEFKIHTNDQHGTNKFTFERKQLDHKSIVDLFMTRKKSHKFNKYQVLNSMNHKDNCC